MSWGVSHIPCTIACRQVVSSSTIDIHVMGTQVVDVKGPTVLQMIKHMRSVENQAEFSHNSDYVPESLGKVCSFALKHSLVFHIHVRTHPA